MANSKLTIKDIAKLAEVSSSTVSRVIDDNPRISDETKKHVSEIINKYGYKPQSAARSLARNRTNSVGIVIPHNDINIYSSSFFHEALKGICSTLAKQGYDVLISAGNPTELDAIKRLVSTSRIDGIILLRSTVNDMNVEYMYDNGFPFILIGTCLEHEDVYCVDNDNFKASFDLTDHIYKCGKKRIALIGGSGDSVFIIKRLNGYHKCLEQHNIPIDSELVKLGQSSEAYGYDTMRELLNNITPPDAVIVMDETTCVGVMKAINDSCLKIPEQVAVACFNEGAFTNYSKPAITTISLDFYELGARAATNLLMLLGGNKVKKGCCFVNYNLSIRESTRANSKVNYNNLKKERDE
jgi:DNA-binding LacI/PurR family transcriptional regulator